MRFDEYGNVVGNRYIRKVERKDGKLVNAVVKTYPDVSQFWTYKPEEFLKQPVYSRDFPPAKNLENYLALPAPHPRCERSEPEGCDCCLGRPPHPPSRSPLLSGRGATPGITTQCNSGSFKR